ncbi:ABC transporter permease [Nocardia jiangxiensis]|uniref:ABC transporter permease n=1 Tax=Nocardia jiangxiensis TaxID=282685 RepID=A0ABW6RXB7_9NOCA|nr:ABC transporter permease [Nocardia jiangxiensis]
MSTAVRAASSGRRRRVGIGIARVVGQRVVTLLVVLIIVWAAVDLLPGNGVAAVLGRDATPEQIAAREHALGLDRPLPVRFASWLGGLFTGDFGTTVRGTSINALLDTKFPNTLLLGGVALAVTAVAALAGGAWWTLRPHGPVARVLGPTTTMVIAIPEFVIATLLVFVFSLGAGWFPAVTQIDHAGRPAQWSMLVLPVLALAIPQSGWNIRVTRAALAEAAALPHVRAAELDGLSARRIMTHHVLPLAAPTIVASLVTSAGMLLGGALVVETIFNYPGIGSVLASSVTDRDASVVVSVVAVTGAAITLALLLADALRAWAVRGRL